MFRSVVCRSHDLQRGAADQSGQPMHSPITVPKRQDPAVLLYSSLIPAILHLQACAAPQASQVSRAPQVRLFMP